MPYLRTVCLLAKKYNREAAALAETVEKFLLAKGVKVFSLEKAEDYVLHLNADAAGMDLFLVFGGDGTMINAARHLAGKKIPLAGVNLGRVGFLPELSRTGWQDALTQAMERGFEVDERMLLKGELVRNGEVLKTSTAVNEFVISRGGIARLISMELSAAGRKVLYLRADGLIVCTPTGSTAYAHSAGGPLLHPSLNAYCVMAVCPFLSRFQPLAMNAESVFSVKLCEETGSNTCLSGDGQAVFKLQSGDIVRIKGVPGAFAFARFGLYDYFDKLRSTGMVMDSPG
jgi:NAD+ kinase